MKEKKKTRKRLILFFILIILFLSIFFLSRITKNQTSDDFLFVKLLSNNSKESEEKTIIKAQNENRKEYRFKINYKNMDFKSIDLVKTIDKETLMYEKIAPGTRGSFNIILDSNQILRYKINIQSLNEKPKNLKFTAKRDGTIIGEENTLEELAESLTGYINKNQEINITIYWYWKYEDEKYTEENDIQDTQDAKNIKTYKFNISTIGEEWN